MSSPAGKTIHDSAPRWSTLAILLSLSLLPIRLSPGPETTSLAPLISVLAAIIPICAFASVIRIDLRGTLALLLALWLYLISLAALSTLWSPLPFLTLKRTLLVFLPWLSLILLIRADPDPWRTFVFVSRWILMIGLALAVIGLLLLVVGNTRFSSAGLVQTVEIGPITVGQRLMGAPPLLRISSLTANPNGLAAWLMVTIGLTLLLAHERRWARFSTLLVALPLVAALLFTFSRNGLAVSLLVLGLFLLFKDGWRLRNLVVMILLTVGIAGLFFAVSRLVDMDFLSSNRLSTSLNTRELAWRVLWDAIRERPILGHGFGIVFEGVLEDEQLEIGAHSGHLTVLTEMGLAGFVVILVVWLGALIRGINYLFTATRHTTPVAAAVAIVSGIVVHQLFETSLFRFSFVNFFLLYLVSLLWLTEGPHRTVHASSDRSPTRP